jgi:arylamine N-acetyltransferase
VRLKENNEWEGETWRFWLQRNGNEEALDQLADVLESYPLLSETFTLDLEHEKTEDQVDELVQQAIEDYEQDGGYTYEHNKITGTLVWPTEEKSMENWTQDLNKGSIKDFFKED